MFLFSVSSVLAQTNLIINDLENMNFDGLTVQDYSGTTQDYDGFGMNFEIRSYNRTQPDFPWTGGVGDAPNVDTSLGNIWFWDYVPIPYIDEDVSNNNPIVVKITTDYIADIRAGDFITLTYDGGQTLDVHLPEIKGRIHKPYFIATDGSTYHDGALTNLVASENIVSIINVYRFDDNACSLVSIDEDIQTNLEFLTLDECEANILPQLCEESSIKQYSCVDNVTSVDWCVCTNGDWVCSDNPETQCPEIPKGDSGMIIIGLIVSLTIIFLVALYIKKKR